MPCCGLGWGGHPLGGCWQGCRPLGPTRQLGAQGPSSPSHLSSSRGGSGAGLGVDRDPAPPPQRSCGCPLLGCPCPTAGAERTCFPARGPALIPPASQGCVSTQGASGPTTGPATDGSHAPGPSPQAPTWSRAGGTPLGPHQEPGTPVCPRDAGRGDGRRALHKCPEGSWSEGPGAPRGRPWRPPYGFSVIQTVGGGADHTQGAGAALPTDMELRCQAGRGRLPGRGELGETRTSHTGSGSSSGV